MDFNEDKLTLKNICVHYIDFTLKYADYHFLCVA